MKKNLIDRLKTKIEKHLNWGISEDWGNYDFEKLNEEIQKTTGVNLSMSTLKRFFGKVKYDSQPSLTTLNTLSAFIGFQDWRDFKASTEEIRELEPRESLPNPKRSLIVNVKPFLIVGGLALMALVAFFIQEPDSKTGYDPKDFRFSSKTVLAKGVPNSVIFDYDASKAEDTDTVYISQSWDVSRKFSVDKNDKHHSSIYFYPGYYQAKLMVGDQVVKEHAVQITTDGWLGLVSSPANEKPLYFTKSETVSENGIEVTESLMKKYELDLFPDLPGVQLFNFKDISGFSTTNFEFETEVKSNFSAGKGACQKVNILLHAKNGFLLIPLSKPECVGDLFLAAFGANAASQAEDLSGFGCNLSEWVKVRVSCINGLIRFFVDGSLAYETSIEDPVDEIVGVQYQFEGPGSLRNTRLISGQKVCEFD